MNKNTHDFAGAWVTDIDDTVIPSGHFPDDEWLQNLAAFIRQLKTYNMAWIPVSGVALDKMGHRLLYRLPHDVLSHVIYYGGEGGVKSLFDASRNNWYSPDYFQRNFSDAQSLVIIGEQRFRSALKTLSTVDCGYGDVEIQNRIDSANKIIKQSAYKNMLCLVDQMQDKLSRAGFDANKAETYFRGGAISWMMFGDVSVKNYQGEEEAKTRLEINAFIAEKLTSLDYLQDIGEQGVHMPYLHATRGIKLVLMGNDKGRAIEDLMQHENIDVDSLLFVGNELFAGGNDNPVRRIENLTILSVGEKQDRDVIDGGVQVAANQYWMNELSNLLAQGLQWNEILKKLPKLALAYNPKKIMKGGAKKSIVDKILLEKKYAHKISTWHEATGKHIPEALLAQLYLDYRQDFSRTRQQLLKVKETQYELVTKLAVLNKYNYDHARKIVMDLLGDNASEKQQSYIISELKKCLIPEISSLIKVLLVDHLSLNKEQVSDEFNKIKDVASLRDVIQVLIESSGIKKSKKELQRKLRLIDNWELQIDALVDDYFNSVNQWKKYQAYENEIIRSDATVQKLADSVQADTVCDYLRWLIARIDDFPHLKDLDKPTIILVAGTSGVGKSTISRHISKTLGIPTGFSSDVASRSVMREALAFLLGNESAKQLYPEIFGSSFDQDTDDWFYAHSLMTMVGVVGNIKRLISENISAVIDGVALIPGTLPEIFFEKANIVWIVASVRNKELHYQRLGTRSETGVERGGADHYWQQFEAIRRNHDRLVLMAGKSHTFIVDNSDSLDDACSNVLGRVNDAIADRGLYVEDELRELVEKRLHERTTWEVQDNVMNPVDE